MPALSADIGNFQEYSARQLALHPETEIHGVPILEIRIDHRNASKRLHCGSAGSNAGQIGVFVLDAERQRGDRQIRKDEVAFGTIVVHPKTATNRCFSVCKWRESKTESRCRYMLRFINAAPARGRNREHVGIISVRYSTQLI